MVTIQYRRVPSAKSIRPSAIRGRYDRMVSMRSPKPAASKTTKNTSAAIRASKDSPLVMVFSADRATPAKLDRFSEETASLRAWMLIPKPASVCNACW